MPPSPDKFRRLGHELRNILSPALMMAERLQSNEDPKVSRAGRIVMESIDRATASLRAAVAAQAIDTPAPPEGAGNGPGWDPAKYLQFAEERLRPALDLLARIPSASPSRVVDLGCGPGNVTTLLKHRWPEADVLGIDSSAAMIEAAASRAPLCRFTAGDIGAWQPDTPPDVIYSNAALHWLGGHETLFPRLAGLLAPGGVLAVQMPLMHDAPFRRLQAEVAAEGSWATHLRDVAGARKVAGAAEFHRLLRPHCATLDIWETTYLHVLQGRDAVQHWAMGTSLRPYLDRLPAEFQPRFLAAYAEALRPVYPQEADGTTLLPFRRLFILATAAT